ncbi:hypothetical protein DTL21_07740 [Bremerella cremea]|nr:hypothetical protein DTL21_07740 [Bremerella cremea]
MVEYEAVLLDRFFKRARIYVTRENSFWFDRSPTVASAIFVFFQHEFVTIPSVEVTHFGITLSD